MLRFGSLKISHMFMISIGVIFMLGAALNVVLVLHSMRQQSLAEAEAKARMLLDRNLATHTYFNQIMKPKLLEWTAPFRAKDYFEPSWMSSTYAIREIHKYFNAINPEGYYIKDAAINARSPENEADAFEKDFLQKLQKDGALQSHSEVRTIDGEPYLTVMRRGEVLEPSCLACHSNPGAAPGGLVSLYGAERSFQRNNGELVSVISMHIPLSAAYADGNRTSLQLSAFLAAALALLFGVQAYLYRRFLISPLGVIRDQALAIAGSDEHLGETVSAPAGRELEELADAFNAMSQKLRRSLDQLEARVAERTQELKASNAQLEIEIAERKQMEEQVRQMAFHDALTRLPNRRLLADRISQALAASKRSGCYGALMFLDLDNFKLLNDQQGHETGDSLLLEAAERLKACVREIDTVARFGGDEFVVVAGDLGIDRPASIMQAGIIAEKIRTALARPYALKVRHEGKAEASVEFRCTASVGVTLFDKHDTGQDAILRRADAAMYQAKEMGGDAVRFSGAAA